MARRQSQALRRATAIAVVLWLVGCKKDEPERVTAEPWGRADRAPAATSARPAPRLSSSFSPLLPANQLRIVTAPKGDVAVVVRDEASRQTELGRTVLVYVGARWCEPCQRFHRAAAAGELDRAFPDLTLVEFDLDDDGERLETAGYRSRFIPLFALPAADGRASGKFIEGSVKGDGAVGDLSPRLKKLLSP